jgi:DNA-binding beta-propeller fold protein YncE
MAVSADGTYLFSANAFNNRVLVYNIVSITDDELPVNVIGQQALDDYGYGTSAEQMFAPSGLWLANGNGLYVSDSSNNRVMKFNISPVENGITAEDAVGQLATNNEPVFTVNGANDSPNALGYKLPAGVAIDTTGHRLFVTDAGNNRVLMYTLNAHDQLDDHVADAVLGQPDFKGNAARTTASGMNAPSFLAYDSTHQRLFVADSGNNRVLGFDVSSITDGEDAAMVFGQGSDIESPGNFQTAGSGVGVNGMNVPVGVAVDETHGALLVVDMSNNRVLAFDYDAGSGVFADGDADRVFGQSGSFDTGTSGTSNDGLTNPGGVYVDVPADAFWVADSGNHRVLRWALTANSGDPASAVLGQTDFDSNQTGTTETTMSFPEDITKDDNTGDLYIVDSGNNRVLSFSTTDGVENGEAASAVYGQASFGTADSGTTAETLMAPISVAYDSTRGSLWVADQSNNRVLYFGPLDDVLTPLSGGHSTPGKIGFFPLRIVINSEDQSTDSKNVLVDVYAQYDANFTGTVDVLLSNTPDFSATVPFRYTLPLRSVNTAWNRTIAWDLCFGLPATTHCDPGKKVVYARFYVNVPSVWPALTPLGLPQRAP